MEDVKRQENGWKMAGKCLVNPRRKAGNFEDLRRS